MKRLGCCTLCDKEVWDVTARFVDSELSGRPRSVSQPHESARRVWLLFANGNHGYVTLCDDCQATHETLPEIHAQIRRAWAFEGTNGKREQAGEKPLTERQQWIQGAWQLGEVDNIPIGVLCEERWTDVMEEKR